MSNDGDLFDNDWINFIYSFPAPTLFNSFYALTDLAMASNEARVNGVVEKANNTAESEVACGLNAPKIYNTPIFREELPMPLESNENTFHMGTGTRDAATFSVFSQRNTFALESTSVNNPDFVLKKGGGQRRIREARFTCLYCPQRLTTKQRLNTHVQSIHFKNSKTIECCYCFRRLTGSRSLHRHQSNKKACPNSLLLAIPSY